MAEDDPIFQRATVENLDNIEPTLLKEASPDDYGYPGYKVSREAAASVQAFYSTFNNGEWEHEWGIEGKAQSWDSSTFGTLFHEQVKGHKYIVDNDGGDLYVSADDHIGSFPSGNGSAAPDWTVPLLSKTIGSAITPIGWFKAGNDALAEKFGADNGYDLGSGQYEYTKVPQWGPWGKAGHYARFKYEQDDLTPVTCTFKYATEKTIYNRVTHWASVEMDVEVLGPPEDGGGGGECPGGDDQVCPQSTFSSNSELPSPHEMTRQEKETLGLRRIESQTVQSMDNPDKIRTADGKIPKFIATNPPLKVTEVRRD